jgi:hypothetical protein
VRLPLESAFRKADWRILGEADFPYDPKRYYSFRVENDGPRMRCSIDGKLLIEASDNELLRGRVGIAANMPARFTDFRVTVSDQAEGAIQKRIDARERELAQLRLSNPQPKLWKRFKTPLYGAGRNARFGDLDGDGRIDAVVTRLNEPVEIFLNRTEPSGHYLLVKLVGTRSNRDGLGATLRLVLPSGRSLVRQATSAVGYGGSSDKRVHFGLGGEDRIERLEVTWPGGQRQVLEIVGVDRIVEIREGAQPSSRGAPLSRGDGGSAGGSLGTRQTGVPRDGLSASPARPSRAR